MGILDILFPKICVGCNRAGGYLCSNCARGARLAFPAVCPVCEKISLDGATHQKCKSKISPDGLTSIWVYERTPRKVIKKLKYKFVSDLVGEIAEKASEHLLRIKRVLPDSLDLQNKNLVLVPIPIHWARENWRGFNQASEVGKLLAKQRGWQFADMLQRTKYTKSQVGLSEKERDKNIQGVFSLKPNVLTFQQSSILLFDDVWTTGATILEATKVLKEAGFKKVWCLTLCR